MTNEIKHWQMEKRSPEGRRRVVVSCAQIAIFMLKRLEIEPTPGEIRAIIIKTQSSPAVWERFLDKAHMLRVAELSKAMEGKTDRRGMEGALHSLNQKYHQIDGDPRINFSYLDDIVLGNGVDESQKTTSQR